MSSLYQRQTAPEPERRGAVQRFNDRALEYLIVLFRVLTVNLGGFAIISAFAWIWAGGWRWGVTLAVALLLASGAGYLGFWVFGNEEWWRRGDTD